MSYCTVSLPNRHQPHLDALPRPDQSRVDPLGIPINLHRDVPAVERLPVLALIAIVAPQEDDLVGHLVLDVRPVLRGVVVDIEPDAEQVAVFRKRRRREVSIIGHGEGSVGDRS
jgi:hypothetical protein